MRLRSLLAALAATLLVGGGILGACGPGVAEPLTDPREILSRTIRATSALRTVDLRLEYRTAGGGPGLPFDAAGGGVFEAQVDFVAGELAGRMIEADGREVGRLILADGALFASTNGGRWVRTAIPGGEIANPALLFLGGGVAGAGNGPDYFAILSQAVDDEAIDVQLTATEDCRPGRCYRTLVTIPPAAMWPLAVRLVGLDAVPGVVPPAPDLADVPAVALTVLTHTATLWLEELLVAVTVDRSSVEIRLQLANHDAGLQISPPPPELVDPGPDMGDGGVGPAVPVPAPVPAPVEPVQPVETPAPDG